MAERKGLGAWLASTPVRTFVVYPVIIALIEFALQGGRLALQWWGAPLLLLGYLQYRWVGAYRKRLAGGGPGLKIPPQRILDDGPYAFVRNPMYLGHLVFTLGVAVFLRSWIALALFVGLAIWFDRRVRGDEERLEASFGEPYRNYKMRVKRWIPCLL